MTLQQLEYILAVARYGHFGRAAEACNVTQPTLSAMIGKLEEEIGAKLFDRNRQPICPTPVGERVVHQAREVLEQADSIKDIVLEEKQSLGGIFRVGILPTIAPYLLPRPSAEQVIYKQNVVLDTPADRVMVRRTGLATQHADTELHNLVVK